MQELILECLDEFLSVSWNWQHLHLLETMCSALTADDQSHRGSFKVPQQSVRIRGAHNAQAKTMPKLESSDDMSLPRPPDAEDRHCLSASTAWQ